MKKQKLRSKSVRWRRFSHTKWAVFSSLHLKITIGVLSLGIVTSSEVKAKNDSHETVSIGHSTELSDDSLAYELDDVEVVATRVPLTALESPRMVTVMTAKDVASTSALCVNDLLAYATGVDVRQRGEMGIQTDISIRGGTFDQITILLNGVNLSSPHTGHLAFDFPVSLHDVERIEILSDPASHLFGTTAFSGAINIVTRIDTTYRASVHTYGGAYGLFGGETLVNYASKKVQNQLSLGYSQSDGATVNSDFDQKRMYYQGKWETDDLSLSWQGGYTKKNFGANTFYSAAYPNQWEGTERYMASVRAEKQGKIHIVPIIYWNRAYDHFQLIRNTNIGENFHRTEVLGVHLNSWFSTTLGKTSVGVEVRNEDILSTNLGKDLSLSQGKYTKKDNRTNWSYYLEHDVILSKWSFSVAMLTNMNTGLKKNDWLVYPSVNVCCRPFKFWKLFISYNKALRMPTFTEIYYKSPTNKGNKDLSPEEIEAWNVGFKYRNAVIEWQLSGFYNQGKKMIDWVMYDVKDIYHSVNFGLDNRGVESQYIFYPRSIASENFFINKVYIGYAYMNQKRYDVMEIYKSNYALEYLRHKVTSKIDGRIVKNLNFSVVWFWQERMGSYIKFEKATNTGIKLPYKPYSLTDLHISWDRPRYNIYIDVNNVFDVDYYDFGNLPQPGRWIKSGIRYRI